MMSRRFAFLAVAVFAVGVAVTLAVPRTDPVAQAAAPSPGDPTVGDFVVRYATSLGLAGQNARPEDAVLGLRKAGAIGPEPVELSAPLTEGDVVRLGGRQLRISTDTPGRAFSQARFAEFFDVFGPELRQAARRRNEASLSKNGFPTDPSALVPDFDPPVKGGKGKGKGHSPSEP